MSSSEGPTSLRLLRRDVELNPDAPKEPLLSKVSDDSDPQKTTQTARTSTRRFERPNFLHIVAHAFWCCAAYPIVHVVTVVARDTTLFRARAIVGVWCSGVGFVTGWSLVEFATKYIEAATWATVIHLSHGDDSPGIKLRKLARNAHQSESALSGFKLLWTRLRNRGTEKDARRPVDSRWWCLFITFYVILIFAAAAFPFILGRVVNIDPRLEHQLRTYTETTIWGDLSESDNIAAMKQFSSLTTTGSWTLASLTDRSSLPPAVRLKYNEDNVYFAELAQSQLKSDGKGLGAFIQNGTVSDVDDPTTPSMEGLSEGSLLKGLPEGSLLKTPRWGIRIHCEKLSEPEKYLVPHLDGSSLSAYVIVTRAFLENLLSSFSLPGLTPDTYDPPSGTLNLSDLFGSPDGTPPSGTSVEEVSYISEFEYDGRAHAFRSYALAKGESGNGWVVVEIVLIRLHRMYTPNATFPVWGADPAPGFDIGYDAAVCVQMYEPWTVQIYKSSLGVPTTMTIVGKSATTDFESDDGNRGPRLDSYTRALNSTGNYQAFNVSHNNAIRQMLKDNDLQLWYAPSPVTVSFTGNVGPNGYTELSPQFYADVRGEIDASYALPFLSGTRPIVVRAYKDEILASASFNPYILSGVLGITLLLGALAGLFVPALPFDIPRRDFGLFSWVAVMYGQELGRAVWQDKVDRHMDLKELEKTLGEESVHFVIS